MRRREFIFWVALPPVVDDLKLLEEAAGIAEPLLDLRYGSENYKESILKKAVQQGLAGLTVFVDCRKRAVTDFLLETLPADSRVILSSVAWDNDDVALLLTEFRKRDFVTGIEVDNRNNARQAIAAGADFLVTSGNEAYGQVSVKTSLILIQELLESLDIPLVIRGSLGPQGAAGAMAAGCSGCILDSQLLLVDGSPLSDGFKKALQNFSPSDTTVVGALVNRPYRLLCIGARDEYHTLVDLEKKLFLENGSPKEKTCAFEEVLEPAIFKGFSEETTLLPVGEGIAFAQQFAEEHLGIRGVLEAYQAALNDSIACVKANFPLSADSSLARYHKVKYPVVQGPMARVAGNPRLAVEVAKGGALPFVAAGGLPPEETRRMLTETRSALGKQPFGVGIIGFSPFERTSEQMEAVLAEPPDFITIAGGDPGLVRRFEEAGIGTYLHAPSLVHVKEFLDKQVKGIILEGHEAGGHVGALGSLVLWELGVREIMARDHQSVASTRLLLAGGIANARGALVAAVLASPLLEQNVALGLQIGTAYLMTDEAVESGAIPGNYSHMLLDGNETAITGQSVNLPSRWLIAPAVHKMIETELRLEKDGLPLAERKNQVEKLNLDHMNAALIEPENKQERAEEEDSPAREAYMCGQMISVQSRSRGIVELHQELTSGAQQLAESCPILAATREIPEDAIAIIGMGCIFPGAKNLAEYWENIIHCVDTIREVPKERWNPDLYYDPDRSTPDKTYAKIGAFVEGFEKDPLKFRIPPASATFIDRVQFMALEVTHQALEDAGYLEKDFPRKRTGVFMGCAGGGELRTLYSLRAYWSRFAEALESVKEFEDLPDPLKDAILHRTEKVFKQEIPEFSEDTCGGVFQSIVAGRICNCFDLGGPGLVLDAACASSLATVDVGVTALREGRLDMVLAGGVDVRLDAATYVFFSSLGAISAKGSFPFDERADGFVLGEGAGMVLLKRLEDAIRDGDKIYAIIQSLGASSDGRVKGITAPDVKGQICALERAYEKVPFTPDTVSLIEAHGTGTWAGDIAEITSLTEFIRQYSDRKKFIGLGSVKSMIGHLKAASAVAGLIKAALALHNRVLPPTINCEQPRKEVDWQNSPFYLLTETRSWEEGHTPRRAAVDSFGFGGINFHAVLEEAPREEATLAAAESAVEGSAEFPAELLVFRTSTRAEMRQLVESTKEELIRARRPDLREIAVDLLKKAVSTGPTLAIVAADVDELISHLNKAQGVLSDNSRSEFTSAQGIYFGETPLGPDEKVAFLFPGQGSQYIDMGGDLPSSLPFVGEIFRQVDSISRRYNETSILPVLLSAEENPTEEKLDLTEMLVRPDCNHPAMLAIGMALVAALSRAGIQPDMVAGHSLGEYLALYTAGVFDMETAIDVTTGRGCGITQRCFRNGAMASIGASEEILEDVLEGVPGLVAVANKNCPAQTVISGDVEGVEGVMARLEKKGILCSRLPVLSAYHTPLLSPCVEPFHEFLDKFAINPPKVPVQSNLTGRAYEVDENFAPRLRDTLVKHLIRPVEFINNILSMYEDGARLFVEVGPGSTLSSFVDNILTDRPHWTVPTNLPRRSATLQLLHALAFCASRGIAVDIRGIMPAPRRRRALRRTAFPPASKRLEVPAAAKSEAAGMPDLIGEALADQNAGVVEHYLKQRGGFLKDMLLLDFKHFTGVSASGVAEKRPADDGLEKQVVELVSQKTGYPPDFIDIDLDVEAELGIDSIKQVEIIRELALKLDIDFGGDPRSQRYKITTLRKLIETCRSFISEEPAAKQFEPAKQELEAQTPGKDWNIDCHRWVCEKVETPLLGEKNPQALNGRHVLLMAGEDGPGVLLKSRLEEAGATVSAVSPSNSPKDFPKDFDLVLDLWAYTEDEAPTLERSTEWWEGTARRASAVLRMGQNLIDSIRANENRRALWVEVTSLGGELGARAINRMPARAGIGLGMSRCLLSEFTDRVEGLYLDFDPEEPDAMVADCVLNELTHGRHHSEVGYAQGKRFEIRWKIDDASNEEHKFELDSQSVVLAIGGARGITASICRELAKHSGAQFIVVGSSPFSIDDDAEPREPITFDAARNALLEESRAEGKRIVPARLDRLAWEHVWETERPWNMTLLRSVAGHVAYRQCDVTDADAVRRLVREVWQEYGRIDLVIHGGGTLLEKSVEDFDPEEFIAGMKSKALGTACLLAALSGVEVGAFVNLSSIAGRWGNIGQSSYTAGHEVASILVAGACGKRPGRWFNIFYGPWLNVGMTRKGATMERLRARGVDFVTEKAGSDFFVKEFESNPGHSVGFCGDEPVGLLRGLGGAPTAAASRAPLLDHVDIVAPGVAEGRRIFDLKRDRFVADHYVHYEYPIMPGVVSLEMLSQTAFVLTDPEFSVTDIEDVTFPRAGTFPRGETREFRTRARLLSKDEAGAWFASEMFSLFTPPGSAEPQEIIHARCRVRFGHRQAPQKPSLLLVSTGIGDCHVDAEPLWKTKVFKGRMGIFRNIRSFSSVTCDGVVGEVLGARVREFGERPLLDDPIRLDGVAHLLTLSTCAFQDNPFFFVAGLKSIKFFAADDPGGMRFCRIRIREINETDLIYDVEAMDSMNKVVERMTGVRRLMAGPTDAYELPEPIWDSIRENPRQAEIRRLLGYDDGFVLAHVRISLGEGALEADGEELLREQLTGAEIKRSRSLTHPKRRLEWLAGRIVAKGAIRIFLGSKGPRPSAIEVESSPDNAPHIVIKGEEADSALPHISISHSSDMAVAVAAQSPGVGIDVEEITGSILEIADEFSTNEEVERVSKCAGPDRLIVLVSIWAVKEAARKAVGTETCSMKELVLQEARKEGEYIVSEVSHPMAGRLRTVSFQSSKYVYAVSLSREPAIECQRECGVD